MKRKIIISTIWALIIIFTSAINCFAGTDDYPSEYKAHTYYSPYYGNSSSYYGTGIADKWNFYTRECTSFVAWRLNSRNKVSFTNQYKGASKWGNAVTWGTVAKSLGITVNNTPAVGAVAWWNNTTYGHVAWVESVSGDNVTIEEYNVPAGSGKYNRRTISKSNPRGYIHIKDLSSTEPTPSNNTWVKTNKSSYSVNETVTFTFGYKYSTSVSLGIFKDGKKYAQPDVTGKSSYSRSFSEPGTYMVYVSGWSPSGYEDSPQVTFTVSSSSSPQTWVKTNKTVYNTNETVTFTFGYKYSTSVSLGIFKDGKKYAQPDVTGKSSYSRSFSEPGTYMVYASGWSPSGYEDSAQVIFTVTNGVTDSPTWVQIDKSYYRVGEPVNFTFSYKYTTSVSLGIDKDGKRYAQPEVTGKSTYSRSFDEEGTYSVYVSGWSQSGYEDSKKVTFTVYNPNTIPALPFTITSHGNYSDVHNTALLPQTGTIIIADINDGKLSGVTSELYTFTAGETKRIEHSELAHVFVWDSLEGMKPLAAVSYE